MEDQQSKPIPKPIPYKPLNYFVSPVNTKLGELTINRLRNDDHHPQNPHCIVGTFSSSHPPSTPSGVRKVVNSEKVKFFQDVILNSDVVIYDLNECDLKEAEFVISTLKIHPYTQPKILLCVSNVMTWAKTKPKEKGAEEEEEDDQPPLELEEQQEENVGQEEEGEKKIYVRHSEKDYPMRKAAPHYEKIKSLETLCLAAGSAKQNLKTYVVCSGILYGLGQGILEPYFMQARLQEPKALEYYGKGKNRIPMVHICDLVTYIQKIILKKPDIPYFLALDHNPQPTQIKMIEAISKGIGTGLVISKPLSPEILNLDKLSLDLRLRPTMFFSRLEEQEAGLQEQEDKPIERFKFGWVAKEGLQKNMELIRKEFNQAYGLKQQKILIQGPPGCGKTHFAAIMAIKYYLPHIHIKGVITEVCELQEELGEEVRNFLAQQKETLIQEKQALYEELVQKNKKIPKDLRQPLKPFDPEAVDARLSDELVHKCYKWRLTRNDCLNRGYVLDGFPRSYQDAREIFTWVPPTQEGQEPEEGAKKVADDRLMPDKYIVLESKDNEILTKLQQLPEESIKGTHFNQTQTKRRLKAYHALNNNRTGEFILEDFFKEQKVSIYRVNVTSQTAAVLESIIKPIHIDENAEQAVVGAAIKGLQEQKAKRRKEMDKREQKIRSVQNEDYIMKKENEHNEEIEILHKKSLSLRKYLQGNLVFILSDGITEILKEYPNDPVDYLARFLFKNSLRVPNPDPSTFEL